CGRSSSRWKGAFLPGSKATLGSSRERSPSRRGAPPMRRPPSEGERAMSAHKADEGQTAAKFIQICASQNDLFALDEAGNIYQYNFTATTREKLVAARSTA